MITEYEKYTILSTLIREMGNPIKIKIRKPKQTDICKPIDGACVVPEQTIFLTLPEPVEAMSQTDVSEVTSVLLHEFGHSQGEYSERGAWRVATTFINRYGLLKPIRFDKIKQTDLFDAKMMSRNRYKVDSPYPFKY